jgi:hypothetical protein
MIALLVATQACARAAVSPPAAEPPIIQLRFAQATAAPGFAEVAWLDRDGRAHVAQQVLLSDDGFESVVVDRSPEGLLLCTRVSPEAGARLREATTGAIGRELAVLIDGRVATVAPIMSAIGSGAPFVIGVPLPGPSREQIADRVTSRIAARWPQPGTSGRRCTNLVVAPPGL